MKRLFNIFLLLLLLSTPIMAGDDVGEVIAVRGKVWILTSNNVREVLHRKQVIYVGEKIITSKFSYVKIFLNDDSVLTIGENSKFQITKFVLNNNSRISIFNLIKGKVKAVVSKFLRKGAENKVLVNTPTAVAGVRGTEFIVEASGNTTRVDVLDGEVEVRDLKGMGSVVLERGFSTMVRYGAPPLPPKPLNLHQIRRLKREFFTAKRKKGSGGVKAEKMSLILGEKEFSKFKSMMKRRRVPLYLRRRGFNVKPKINSPLALGNNALVHIKVIFP